MSSAIIGTVLIENQSTLNSNRVVDNYSDLTGKDKTGVYYLRSRSLIPLKFKGFYFWDGLSWSKLGKDIPLVTTSEITGGLQTSLRRFSPKNVQDMINTSENWSDYVMNSAYQEEIQTSDSSRVFRYTRDNVSFWRKVVSSPYSDVIYSDSNLTTEVVRR